MIEGDRSNSYQIEESPQKPFGQVRGQGCCKNKLQPRSIRQQGSTAAAAQEIITVGFILERVCLISVPDWFFKNTKYFCTNF